VFWFICHFWCLSCNFSELGNMAVHGKMVTIMRRFCFGVLMALGGMGIGVAWRRWWV
jgi:hypothetical protein